jgi:hypothetical protein
MAEHAMMMMYRVRGVVAYDRGAPWSCGLTIMIVVVRPACYSRCLFAALEGWAVALERDQSFCDFAWRTRRIMARSVELGAQRRTLRAMDVTQTARSWPGEFAPLVTPVLNPPHRCSYVHSGAVYTCLEWEREGI